MVNRNLHRFIVFTAACTFFLLIAGALVTSNDAGLAVPDWPLSYGSLLPPMVGGIFYEHGHRMMASFVGMLTIVLAIWTWQSEPRQWVRWLGVATLGLVVGQGVVGGITVLYYLPAAVSSAHATFAQLFFCSVVSLAVFTGAWWKSDLPILEEAGSPPVRALAVAAASVLLLQLILGAAFRHRGIGILPHLVGAAVATAMILWTAAAVLRRHGRVPALRRSAELLLGLLGAQLLLGAASYWEVLASGDAPQPPAIFVLVTVAHVAVGALTLAAAVVLALCCHRLLRPAGAVTLGSRAERATI
jgi:cytochrome c oxidase assembly protein subunit 15